MRTIKFRAWNTVSNEWIRISSLQYIGDGIEAVWELREGENEMYGTHQAILSQFTGLLDKNGKEIWEGDIVLEDGKGPYQVEWQDGLFTISCYGGRSWHQLGEVEVIGNIFENNELLK